MMKCKVEKFEVEKKSFQVKFEGSNGGTWVSVTERSRGFVVSVGFGREEVDWLTEHLKKAVELENTRGFTRKFRGENKIHLMEICFNNRGRFHENHRDCHKKETSYFLSSPRVLKMSKSRYRGGRSYAEVVAEDGIRSGVPLAAGKWARAVICECKEKVQDWTDEGKAIASRKSKMVTRAGEAFSERKACSPKKMLKFILKKWGRVTEVAREAVKLLDLTKVKLWVEMHPNVVLPALLEVEDGAWKHTVAVSVIGEEGEDGNVTSETSHCRYEWLKEGGCVSQTPKFAEGLRGSIRGNECYRRELLPRARYRCSSTSMAAKREKGWEGQIGLSRRSHSWAHRPESSTKAHPVRAQKGRRSRGLHAGPDVPQAHDAAASLSSPQRAGSSAKATTQPRSGDERAGVEARRGWAKFKEDRCRLAEIWSREEESAARKGKAPMDQMEDFTQGEKRWIQGRCGPNSSFQARIAVMDNGVAARLFPYGAQRHLKATIWKWMAGWDLNRYEVSERVPSSVVFCQGMQQWSKEETSTSRGEMESRKSQLKEDKGGFTGRAVENLEVSQPFSSQPPEPYPYPSCNLEKNLPCPSGPHLPYSEILSQSPSVNQGGESESCFNQMSERSTPGKSSNLMPGSPGVNEASPSEDFLIDGLSLGKWLKCERSYALWTLRCTLGGRIEVHRRLNPGGFGLGGLGPVCFSMKIISWNVRGLGSSNKRRVIKDFLRLENPDVVMIQETKKEKCDRRLVGSVWTVRNKDWVILPACGASGGILFIWDSKKLCKEEVVLGSFSISVKFALEGCGPLWISAVYGPNSPSLRKDFWVELYDIYGLTFPLCSFPKAFKKPLSEGPRIIGQLLWIPTRSCGAQLLFRFENMWLQHPSFKKNFRNWWRGFQGKGWEGHKFMRRLQFVKAKVKEWNKLSFGELNEKKKSILKDLANFDAIEQDGGLTSELLDQRALRKGELEELILREEIHWRQKARVKWVKEGDYNSKFFHKVANGRRNRKYIKTLENERGLVLNNAESITEEILLYFEKLYANPIGES
ncbi:hypothetical protein CK203_095963 [Vitis vinifera]|uniref:Endonuclease/exonuclease/phosphatase domain-containing protein n=1 Tax=Vitis vinifera TaxID=29760 RepID=A0A438CRS5_VITVI|nr:hypothetical protein CK203_095963 [Vitis vinifera]